MELKLHDLQFDSQRPGCCLGGLLYISIGDAFFPAENWYDMPFLDLQTWLPRLISFGSNHTDSCELPFMDGPYTARLSRLPDGSITVSCFDDHRLVPQKKVVLYVFFRSVITCLRKYDRFLFENGRENRFLMEIKQLKTLLDT